MEKKNSELFLVLLQTSYAIQNSAQSFVVSFEHERERQILFVVGKQLIKILCSTKKKRVSNGFWSFLVFDC